MAYFGKKLHVKAKHLYWDNGDIFFFLADTQWYGLTKRCSEQEFEDLLIDRKQKGFSAIQLVVGVPPESTVFNDNAHSTHHKLAFDNNYHIRPAYFADIKTKVQLVYKHELVPVLYGSWGPYIDIVGVNGMKDLWDAIVAHFAGDPVIYCLCGEVDLMNFNKLPRAKHNRMNKWQQVADHLVTINKENHPVTAHIQSQTIASELFPDPSFLTIDSMQSGHSQEGIGIMNNNFKKMQKQSRAYINLEPLYEGILGQYDTRLQTYAFYKSIFSGAAGHSYGAHGLWQMARGDHFMSHWGESDWHAARDLSGGTALGNARQFFFKNHIAWESLEEDVDAAQMQFQTKNNLTPLIGKTGTTVCIYIPYPEMIQGISTHHAIQSVTVYNACTFHKVYTGTSLQQFLTNNTTLSEILMVLTVQ